MLRAEGRTVFVPISRRGEVSESEPYALLIEIGEPSDFFVRKPAAKRLDPERGLTSMEVVGGAGIGEEPASLLTGSGT